MADTDFAAAINASSSHIEQLEKALVELEAHKCVPEDKVLLKEIGEHFRDLESRMIKQYSELEAREKAFKEDESDGRALLAAKEEAVAAKEQEMFDRIQEVKDAAVAAIVEARTSSLPASVESNDVEDGKENQVSSTSGDKNTLLGDSKGELHKKGENGVVSEVTFSPELTQFCEQMDAKGLLSFMTENDDFIAVICEELSLALENVSEPGRLVLDSLDGFYPPDDTNNENDTTALQGMRQSCLKILEAMATLLARAESGVDHLLSPEIKQQAKAIADEWVPKLADGGSIGAANGNSLEAEAFLQLLATFRIASEFGEEQLCKLVLAVAQQRQAPELCRSLGLAHKVPGLVEELINKEKQVSAVHFIHAFGLTETFPTAPILKNYLKELRKSSQGKGGKFGSQKEANAHEFAAVKAVMECIRKYNLEADYPLDPLHRRYIQLDPNRRPDQIQAAQRVAPPGADTRKRFRESAKRQDNKKPRGNGSGFRGSRATAPSPAPAPAYVDRAYAAGGLTNSYSYPAPPSQATAYERSFYYAQDDGVGVTSYYSAPPSTYSAYPGGIVQPSYQPYM